MAKHETFPLGSHPKEQPIAPPRAEYVPPLGRTSEEDPRITLWGQDRVSFEKFMVPRSPKNPGEAPVWDDGWSMKGDGADADGNRIFQMEKPIYGIDPQTGQEVVVDTLVKTVSAEDLTTGLELKERTLRETAQRVGSETVAAASGYGVPLVAGETTPSSSPTVERDSDGLIIFPDWMGDALKPEEKPVSKSPEEIDWEHHQRIVEEMAEITKGLSPNDISRLDNYSRYLRDKKDAQSRGDGGGSSTYGQYAGQEYHAMSPEAQKVASQYVQLWNARS
ncbi:MAG: hypothetical protein KA604_02380 [Candidatus Saccharimonas sp.]|nr:hypothetical protein [Candidatus Saccharimonas sp.]